MRENSDQKNSEYGHYSRSASGVFRTLSNTMMEPFCENSGFLSLLQNLFNVNNNDKET